MLTEPIKISGKNPTTLDQLSIKAKKEVPLKDDEAAESEKKLSISQMKGLVADVQQNLKMVHNVDLQFSVHEASGKIMVTVTDKDTGKVIREIPPSEILNLAAKFDEMIGLIFDQKG